MKRRLLYLLFFPLLYSCHSIKYVPVETVKTEYVHQTDTVEKTDSVIETQWMTIKEVDSTELARLGIQLKNITHAYVIEHNKVKELQQLEREVKIDTVYKAVEIQVPYPVEKELTRWQKLKMNMGSTALVLCFAIVVFIVSSLIFRKR